MSSNNLLNFKVLTPDGIIREIDHLIAVNIPLVNDYLIGIRPGHAPLIAKTRQGQIICRSNTSEMHLELYEGVFEVRNNQVTIFTVGEITDQTLRPAETISDRMMQAVLQKMSLNE